MRTIGTLLALISGGVATLILGFSISGTTSQSMIWVGWLGGLLLAVRAWQGQPAPASGTTTHRLGWVSAAVLAIAILFIVHTSFWLVWQTRQELRVGSPFNLGDLALHLAHFRYLSGEVPFWPENPIAAGDPFAYPPGIVLWSLMLSVLGLSDFGVLIGGSLLGLSLGVAACWRWGGPFALAVLLFNGGLAGFAFFGEWAWRDYQMEAIWKSIPLSMLTTQRGLLYALPAGLWLLTRWRHCFIRNECKANWLDGWIYATLPLFSPHAFLALSLLLGMWFLAGIERRRLLIFVLAAFPLAVLSAWLASGGFSVGGGIRWAADWFLQENQSWPMALMHNFGLWTLLLPGLAGWLIWNLLRPEKMDTPQSAASYREQLAFLVPGLLLFLLCLLVVFQPWSWDNTKLMLWGWLIAAPVLWEGFLKSQRRWIQLPLLTLLFFSGFISLPGGWHAAKGGYYLASRSELDHARHLRSLLPPDAPVAIAPDYNHVLLLSGQPVVLGFEGHLWSHGIDYLHRMHLLERLYHGGSDWKEAAEALGVEYMFFGPKEEKRFPDSLYTWFTEAELIHMGPAGMLFRIP